MVIPNLRNLMIKAFQNWSKDNVPRLAAAFSFYAMLSLAPMLVLVVAIAGRVLGDSEAHLHFKNVVESYLGQNGREFLETMVATASNHTASTIASIISIVLALVGASNLFQQLSESIDAIWTIPPHPGIRGFIVARLFALLSFVAFAAVFLAWLGIDSWTSWIEAHTPGFQGWALISFGVSVAFLTLVLALAYRALPKKMVAWGDVWIGAFVAAVGIALSKFLLSLYFAYSTLSAAYGSAGTLVIILLWIYYSAQIFFFGIEVTCTYAHQFGSQVHRHRGEAPIPVPTHNEASS
jgi:membrane protein